MAEDTQTLRQAALARMPISAWLGVVLLFLVFGLIVFAVMGPIRRGSEYEEKRAANRMTKLQAQREQDTAALTSYAWVDKTKGTVRIPIERAMELAMTDLARKKPAPAGPIATPAASQTPAAATGAATPQAAATPPGSPAPSTTPAGATVEGNGSRAQPAAGTNPPNAAAGTRPGPAASPAASAPPAAVPPVSPPPMYTPPAPGSPLPVRGKSPEGQ